MRDRLKEVNKIEILMHEYDALSDQIVQRFIGQMMLYGFLITAVGALIVAIGSNRYLISGSIIVVGLLGALM